MSLHHFKRGKLIQGGKTFSHGRTDCRSAKTKDVLFELIESTFPVFPHLFDCLGHAYLSAYNERIYLISNTTTTTTNTTTNTTG